MSGVVGTCPEIRRLAKAMSFLQTALGSESETWNPNTRRRVPECSVFLEIEYWGGILNTRI